MYYYAVTTDIIRRQSTYSEVNELANDVKTLFCNNERHIWYLNYGIAKILLNLILCVFNFDNDD